MKPARTPRCEHGNRHTKADNGGVVVVPGRMMPPNSVLCVECPLRRDSTPGYLGGYTPEMYLDIMATGASIACHMTPGFQQGIIETQRHCTGVAAFRAHTGVVGMVRGVITASYDATRFVATLPDVMRNVFATEAEFVRHHKPGQKGNDDA